MPPAIIRDGVSQLCGTFCQTFWEDMAFVDTCMMGFWFDCSFLTPYPASRHSDSTPDSRRVPLCVHDYLAFHTVQAALQTATAVVSRVRVR